MTNSIRLHEQGSLLATGEPETRKRSYEPEHSNGKDMAGHGVVGDRMLGKFSDVKKGDPA